MKHLRHALIACFLLCAIPAFASQQVNVNNTASVVPTTTPQLLLPSRTTTGNRQFIDIQNQDPSVTIYFGPTPGTNGFALAPGQDYSPPVNIPGNAIYVWIASGTATGPTVGWEG